jgi:hypothetical protein
MISGMAGSRGKVNTSQFRALLFSVLGVILLRQELLQDATGSPCCQFTEEQPLDPSTSQRLFFFFSKKPPRRHWPVLGPSRPVSVIRGMSEIRVCLEPGAKEVVGTVGRQG